MDVVGPKVLDHPAGLGMGQGLAAADQDHRADTGLDDFLGQLAQSAALEPALVQQAAADAVRTGEIAGRGRIQLDHPGCRRAAFVVELPDPIDHSTLHQLAGEMQLGTVVTAVVLLWLRRLLAGAKRGLGVGRNLRLELVLR